MKDTECDGSIAQDVAQQVIDEEGVHYIIGDICSGSSILLGQTAEERGAVMISPTATNPTVTLDDKGKVRKFVFRSCFVDSYQGEAMAYFALMQSHPTAFIAYNPDNVYVRSLTEAFEKTFTDKGGKVLGKETYAAKQTNFSTLLGKVASSKAEVLFIPDYYNLVNLVGKQAKAMGVKAVLMGGDGWDSSELDLKAMAGGFYVNHYDIGDPSPANVEFVEAYEDRYNGSPDIIAAMSYEAAQILLKSIVMAGIDQSSLVRDLLASGNFNLVTGPIRFDPFHNPIKSAYVIKVTESGITLSTKIPPNQ